VIFRIDNTAGFAHNFYIGDDSELSAPAATTDTGLPDWDGGVMELEWIVPDDISDLKFGCTVPGHYPLMQGTFSAGG
jgi:azurin